jgi:hypothetical protein
VGGRTSIQELDQLDWRELAQLIRRHIGKFLIDRRSKGSKGGRMTGRVEPNQSTDKEIRSLGICGLNHDLYKDKKVNPETRNFTISAQNLSTFVSPTLAPNSFRTPASLTRISLLAS